MAIIRKALIISSDKAFGKLLSQVIEELGHFQTVLDAEDSLTIDAQSLAEADLIIVDADLNAKKMLGLLQSVSSGTVHLQKILIPSKNSNQSEVVDPSNFDFVLPSPFYLPDLTRLLDELGEEMAGTKAIRSAAPVSTAANDASERDSLSFDWLHDADQAARHLAGLSLETSSELSLIIKGDQLWAYAGELPQPAVQEISASVTRFWRHSDPTDLARFVHLSSTGEDYMLYVQPLVEEYALAVVFNAELPFSQMRTQVAEIAEMLGASVQHSLTASRNEGRLMEDTSISFASKEERSTKRTMIVSEPKMESPYSKGMPVEVIKTPAEEPMSPPEEFFHAGPQISRELLYTYVLIPRMPQHYLEGDLAYQLSKWLPQLCLAYAVRLEHLNVLPKRLHWTVTVAADISPDGLAQTMEKQLSTRIFEKFPDLKNTNPSGEFWAQGAFITSETNPSAEVIAAYIARTRARQGIPGKH